MEKNFEKWYSKIFDLREEIKRIMEAIINAQKIPQFIDPENLRREIHGSAYTIRNHAQKLMDLTKKE